MTSRGGGKSRGDKLGGCKDRDTLPVIPGLKISQGSTSNSLQALGAFAKCWLGVAVTGEAPPVCVIRNMRASFLFKTLLVFRLQFREILGVGGGCCGIPTPKPWPVKLWGLGGGGSARP